MSGWIKLHRSTLKWEWYNDINTTRLFLHLLLKANYEPKEWRGVIIEPGQLVTSLSKISAETGLSMRQARRSLKGIQTTRNVTIKTTNKYSIITICNWKSFQDDDTQSDTQTVTQTTRKGATTKEERKKEYKPPTPLPDWVPLQDWNDWIAQRKKKPSARAIDLALAALDKFRKDGFTAEEVLQHCIMNGYQGIFPPSAPAIKPRKPYNVWKN